MQTSCSRYPGPSSPHQVRQLSLCSGDFFQSRPSRHQPPLYKTYSIKVAPSTDIFHNLTWTISIRTISKAPAAQIVSSHNVKANAKFRRFGAPNRCHRSRWSWCKFTPIMLLMIRSDHFSSKLTQLSDCFLPLTGPDLGSVAHSCRLEVSSR